MIIACLPLVFIKYGLDDKIIALVSTKGWGTVIPGGKWEEGETFQETAIRELKEETGLIGTNPRLVFAGLDEHKVYCYTFLLDTEPDWYCKKKDSKEGKVILATWEELKTSKFKSYYTMLEEAYKKL